MSLCLEAREALVEKLVAAKKAETADRRLLAILRRSLASPPGQNLIAVAELEGGLFGKPTDRERRMYYLVAGIFAVHGHHTKDRGFGLALRLLKQRDSAMANSDTLKRRLVALVGADDEQLPKRLRPCMQLLAKHEIGLDYLDLLQDLLSWNRPDRKVQQRWLRQFLTRTLKASASSEAAPDRSTTNA